MGNVEIFKECTDGKLTMAEVDEIIVVCTNANTKHLEMKFNDDRANGYIAFALGNNVTRKEADGLIDRLNNISDKPNWFLGAKGEEYVFVN